LVVRLSLCLGFVLLLALIASVAPAGAVASPRPCVDSCSICEIIESSEKCTTTPRCSPICRVRVGNKMQTIYFHFDRECCTYNREQQCQHQVRCPVNGPCEPDGVTFPKPCKGQTKICGGWIWDGVMHAGSCNGPIYTPS
jgi:hypothetical protein